MNAKTLGIFAVGCLWLTLTLTSAPGVAQEASKQGTTADTTAVEPSAGSATDDDEAADDDRALPSVKHFIDTHIHLYDTTRPEGVPWPPRSERVLYAPHLPADFRRVAEPTGVTGVVIVEASTRIEDNRWVLDRVRGDDFYIGLVGNIDPYRDDFEVQLDRLCRDPRFVGVRARNDRPIDFTDRRVLRSCRALARRDKTLDVLAAGVTVDDVEALARAVPDLRIVFDHVLGRPIDGMPVDAQWIKSVKRLAENPRVYCKVSGLYQQSVVQPAPKDVTYYKSTLDVLWDAFGPDRLIYGSNWPVTKKSGDYRSFVVLVHGYFRDKGQDACEKYFWKNAASAYRLNLD